MPNFEELGFKVGPSFIGYQCLLSTPIQDGGFARVVTHNANILVTKVLTFLSILRMTPLTPPQFLVTKKLQCMVRFMRNSQDYNLCTHMHSWGTQKECLLPKLLIFEGLEVTPKNHLLINIRNQ